MFLGFQMQQSLDGAVNHRVQPLDAGKRLIKFLKLQSRQKFIGVFRVGSGVSKQKSFCYFGSPCLRIAIHSC